MGLTLGQEAGHELDDSRGRALGVVVLLVEGGDDRLDLVLARADAQCNAPAANPS
jgi:hypothetical protein